jgi:tetratricopeptide (TPR) repeat protein
VHFLTPRQGTLSAGFGVYIDVRKRLSSQIGHPVIGLLIVLTSAAHLHARSSAESTQSLSLPCPSQDPADQVRTAGALLEAGNNFYTAGDPRQAEKNWLEARTCASTTPSWSKAVFNLGILEKQQADYRHAVAYFDELLQSHPNDKEPGGDIMEVYRNYSNRSALQISVCYEKLGDYRHALHYAWLAKTRYPYRSWCGTCLQSANIAILKRIAYLSFRVYGVSALAVVALAGVFFRRKRSRTVGHS